MNKLKCLFCVLSSFVFVLSAYSQFVSSEVVANSGERFQAGIIHLEWTLGENATEIFENDYSISTLGFHQTYQSIKVKNGVSERQNISVYPNPVKDFLNIKFQDFPEDVVIELFDQNGKKIHSEKTKSAEIYKFNMNPYADGNYLVHVVSGQRLTYSIVKSSK